MGDEDFEYWDEDRSGRLEPHEYIPMFVEIAQRAFKLDTDTIDEDRCMGFVDSFARGGVIRRDEFMDLQYFLETAWYMTKKLDKEKRKNIKAKERQRQHQQQAAEARRQEEEKRQRKKARDAEDRRREKAREARRQEEEKRQREKNRDAR